MEDIIEHRDDVPPQNSFPRKILSPLRPSA